MNVTIEFLEDFATFKKGDKTNILSLDIVSSLIKKGIVELFKEKKPIAKKQVKKVTK
jgi:hypothetical protein